MTISLRVNPQSPLGGTHYKDIFMSAEIRFIVNDDLNNFIVELCEKTGFNKGDAMRSILFNYKTGKQLMPYPKQLQLKINMLNQVQRCGNNLNQIAKQLNTRALEGRINESTLDELSEMLKRIEAKIDNLAQSID